MTVRVILLTFQVCRRIGDTPDMYMYVYVGSGWLPAHGADSRVSVSSCLSSDGCRSLAARTRVRRGTRNGMGLRRRSAGGGAL